LAHRGGQKPRGAFDGNRIGFAISVKGMGRIPLNQLSFRKE